MKIFPRLVLLVLVLLAPVVQAVPMVHDGVIDLRDWDVQAQPKVMLDGTWLMRWGSRNAEAAPFRLPGVWNGREFNGRQLPAFGHAWYSITLWLPEQHPPLALHYGYLKSAARIYVDGRLVRELGRPAATDAGEIPYTTPGVVALPVDGNRLHLVVEISNHFHYEGGVNDAFAIGAESVLENQAEMRKIVSAVALGATGALALFLLLLMRGYNHIPGARLFVMLLVVSCARILGIDDWLTRAGVAMTWVYRVDYLTLFVFPPLYAWLLRTLYPREVPRWFCHVVSGIDAIGVCAVVVLPVAWFTRLRDPGSLLAVITIVCMFACLSWAMLRRRRDAGIVIVDPMIWTTHEDRMPHSNQGA